MTARVSAFKTRVSNLLLAWLTRLYTSWSPGPFAGNSWQVRGWQGWSLAIASGVTAGPAFLSKSTAHILIPSVTLTLLAELTQGRMPLLVGAWLGLTWLVVAGITFFLLWPALWVNPMAVFSAVFGWIGQSASLERASESFVFRWQGSVPDIGFLFYAVNCLLRTTPLTLAGLLALIRWCWPRRDPATAQGPLVGRQVVWSLLFTVALTIGDKRDARAICCRFTLHRTCWRPWSWYMSKVAHLTFWRPFCLGPLQLCY